MSSSGRKSTLGTRILIGVLGGILVGVFLGDWAEPLNIAGKVYVGLLQMTVLPYVVVSLVTKIGRLTLDQARRLAGRAGAVMVALWLIALAVVAVLPLSLPEWEAGSFFSASLVEEHQQIDFLELYIPTNPFHSLANNVVPAVVLFSILLGVAAITIERKDRLLAPVEALGDSLGRISNGVVAFSPYGTFALAAGAAGTLSPGELFRVAGYISANTLGVVLLAFVLLPAFVALLTPHGYWQVLGKMRTALLTAFATGKLFAVLPIVINGSADLIEGRDVSRKEAHESADMLVPLAYPFPNAGKILAILFIFFAAWYMGEPLDASQYPMLLTMGLLAFFGSPVAAVPFLLGMMRLPVDLLALFLIAGIWCARIGDVVGAMHLAAFTLVCDAWNRGLMKLHLARLVPLGAGVAAAIALTLGLNYVLVGESIKSLPPTKDRVKEMKLYNELVTIREAEAVPNPEPLREGESVLARIKRTHVLRGGYPEDDDPPFAYRNGAGKLVGFDIDLAQRLAWDLGAEFHLVRYERPKLGQALAADHFDLAVGEINSSVRSWGAYHETEPYLDLNASLLVEDRFAKEYRSLSLIKARGHLRLAEVEGTPEIRTGLHTGAVDVEFVDVESPEAFLQGKHPEVDALVVSAEKGAIFTMLYPRYSVVIPRGLEIKVPIVFAVRESGELSRLIDTWIRLKRDDGTMKVLYDHWILGKEARRKAPRWSVIRDVLGWVD